MQTLEKTFKYPFSDPDKLKKKIELERKIQDIHEQIEQKYRDIEKLERQADSHDSALLELYG